MNEDPNVFRAACEVDIHTHEGEPDGFPGEMLQAHPRFVRSPAAFLQVAGPACRDDVLPAFFSALHHGLHMIEGELAHRWLLAAILASVMIPHEYIVAIEPNDVFTRFEWNEFDQTNHSGDRDGDRDRSHHMAGVLDDLDLARKEQLYGFLPRNDLQGLKRSIEKKGPTFHITMIS